VKPGDYELTAEGPSLDAWQVTVEPLRFTLAPTADGVGKTGLELLLRPKR